MRQKGYLLATASGVAAAAAATGGAQAADMAVKSPPPAVQAAPSWTGWYVGLNAGWNHQSVDATYGANDPGCVGCGEIGGGGAGGFIGGGQIGYNWQVNSSYVLGLEATIDGLTGKATAPAQFNTTKGNGVEGQIRWLSTFRGRVGWLMDPDTLLYATGGYAIGGIRDKANPNGFASTAPGGTKSVSKSKGGWVAGGGMEHMFGGAWSHWSVAVEGLYVNLGTTNATNPASTRNQS